ncbi:hypothetical protein U9M48_013151 [Paspalum notatum var. saurae]|uniref:Uncharacterized protein n=1 Tax=Paspalum notatum var. saurae TaxID=547442 RepID=A0AAQ3SZF9_PASNO
MRMCEKTILPLIVCISRERVIDAELPLIKKPDNKLYREPKMKGRRVGRPRIKGLHRAKPHNPAN